MKKIRFTFSLIKESFSQFSDDNALKLGAALSYYTIFSLAPMILVIISLAGIFLGKDAAQGEIFKQIAGLVGKDAAIQLQEIIKNAALSDKTGTAAVVGVVVLVIGATGVFAEIQDSINYIWAIKSKPKKSWLQYLKNRFLSFSLIVTLGFLMIVSLGINTAVDLLSSRLERYFSEVSVIFFFVLNIALVVVIITTLFAVIFKVLPDGHVRWKECFVGAGFTAILFIIGKFAISFYLGKSDLGATYGASASIVILLTWVYYSSVILYFGAEFTKVYAKSDGVGITPNEHAVLIVRREVEDTSDELQLTDKEDKKVLSKFRELLIDPVTDFIEGKLAAIRAEIAAIITTIATPAVYYLIAALMAFTLLIVMVLLSGHFLSVWLENDYLGYVLVLGLALVLLSLAVIYRRKIRALVRNILFKFLKAG